MSDIKNNIYTKIRVDVVKVWHEVSNDCNNCIHNEEACVYIKDHNKDAY